MQRIFFCTLGMGGGGGQNSPLIHSSSFHVMATRDEAILNSVYLFTKSHNCNW